MSGWYSIKRGFLEHDLFRPEGKWTRAEAWLWMIENAAFKDATVDIGGKPHTVPRGSLCYSERFLAEKFGWSQKALRTFLDKLEAHGAIAQSVAKTGQGTKAKRKQVTLCNYDKYQNTGSKTEAKGNQNGSKEEQGNNIPTTSGVEMPPDPVKVLFDSGVKILGAAGVEPKRARQMIGKWRSAHGDEATLAALGRAQREGAIDPVSFVEGCFRFSAVAKAKAGPEIGDVREFGGVRKQYAGNGTGWLVLHD